MAALRETQVHPHQVGGEERRLLPSGSGSDLHHRVAIVVGVAGQEQEFQFHQLLLRPLRLPPGLRFQIGAHLGVVLGGSHPPRLRLGRLGTSKRRQGVDWTQLGPLPAQALQLARVPVDLGVLQLRRDCLGTLTNGFQPRLQPGGEHLEFSFHCSDQPQMERVVPSPRPGQGCGAGADLRSRARRACGLGLESGPGRSAPPDLAPAVGARGNGGVTQSPQSFCIGDRNVSYPQPQRGREPPRQEPNRLDSANIVIPEDFPWSPWNPIAESV